MAKFGTQEWYDVYMEEINKSKAYEEAARTWEGDFYFIVEKGGPVKEPIYGYVDLYHGKCRKAEIVTDPKKYNPEFIIVSSISYMEENMPETARFYAGTDHQAIQAHDGQQGHPEQNHALHQGG